MIESASVHPGAFSISGTSTQPRRIKEAGLRRSRAALALGLTVRAKTSELSAQGAMSGREDHSSHLKMWSLREIPHASLQYATSVMVRSLERL